MTPQMPRFVKAGIVCASLSLPGMLIAGCEKKPSASSNPPAASSTAGASGGKFKIAYIPKNTGNPYFEALTEGFKKGCTELGDDLVTVAPAKADAAAQIPFIKEQIQQGVNAIAISPNAPDTVVPALKEAMAKGIKVVCVDADLTGSEAARDAAVLPMDFTITGKSQIELLAELIGAKGDFAILSATTDAPNQNVWIAGMKETLKDPKYKDMKLVEIAYGNDDPQKSLTEAEALLTKYPNLKGIIAPTTVAVAAAAQAVETAKASSRVQVTGLGTPNQMRRFIQNGTVTKFALWSPSDMGYLTAHLIHGLLKGDVKPAADTSFKAGNLGERKFGANNVVITGPPTIFDKTNIEQFHF